MLSLRLHAARAQQVLEYLEVAGLIDAGVLRNLLEVGKGAPLSLLVGHDGRVVGKASPSPSEGGEGFVVAGEEYLLVVVVAALGSMPVPVEAACPTLHMIFRAVVPGPAASHRGSAINLGRVILLHGLHPVVAVAHPVACRLVASRHHHKRGVVAILVDDAFRLLQQILVDGLSATQANAMIGPRGSLRLQEDAHPVGCRKGCLGRTVAVEAHMVQPILLALAEDAQPLLLVSRRIARLRKAAVLHRATQVERSVVEQDVPVGHPDVAQSDGGLIDIITGPHRELIEKGLHLIPEQAAVNGDVERQNIVSGLLSIRQAALLPVVAGEGLQLYHHPIVVGRHDAQPVDMILQLHLDAQRALLDIRTQAHMPDVQLLPLCLQLDTPHDAIPVALRLVGHAVGVLSHADILDAIVDRNHDLVGLAKLHIIGDIIAMGHRERHLMAHPLPVDIDRGLDVRTFQEERDALFAPFLGDIDVAPVPGMSHEMLLGGEEEGELHLPLHAILLHIGIEEEAGVVERARPLCLGSDGVALAVGEHRSGQHDVVGEVRGVVHRKVPRPSQRDGLLRPCGNPYK